MWRDSILNNATQHGTTIFKWTLVAGLSFRHRQPWHKSRTHRRQTGTSDELQLLNFKRVGCCEPSPVRQPSSPPVGSHLAQPSRRVRNLDATLSRTGRTEHNNSTILWYYASLDNWLHMIAFAQDLISWTSARSPRSLQRALHPIEEPQWGCRGHRILSYPLPLAQSA